MIKTNNKMGIKMTSRSLNIGFENRVISERIIAIVNPNSAPIKKMIKNSRENNMLIDACMGKPKRSLIITDSKYLILSSISPRKLDERMDKKSLE